jgi:hypothetical protein
MKRLGFTLAGSVLAVTLAQPAPPDLPAGEWNGTLTVDGDESPVSFQVRPTASGPSVEMFTDARRRKLQNVKLTNGVLTFSLPVVVGGGQTLVDCRLPRRTDGSFSGTCESDDSTWSITMVRKTSEVPPPEPTDGDEATPEAEKD